MSRFGTRWAALAHRLGLAGVLVLALAAPGRAGAYKVTDIEPVGRSPYPFSTYLNNNGQVAGAWSIPAGHWQPGGNFPFFYDPDNGGKVTLLGVTAPSGQDPGSVHWTGGTSGLNDQGQVVGWSDRNQQTFLYDSRTGQTSFVATPAGSITNSGQVVATKEVAPINEWGNFHPVIYGNGTQTDLGTPPGTLGAQFVAANDAGQVLVRAATSMGNFSDPYLYHNGTWTSLGSFGASALNARGDVIGSISAGSGTLIHAALLPHGGSLVDLGVLPGDRMSSAMGVNSRGDVVGISWDGYSSASNHGFLYENGVMKSLNSLLPVNSGWNIEYGMSINDRGQILAYADHNDAQQLVLLTPDGLPTPPDPVFPAQPVPEPSTVVAFGGLGLALVWRSLRRRAA